jgi:glutamine synthetase
MEAISRQAVRVLNALGVQDVKKVTPTVGGEQEYFLIDKTHFLKRKDLVYTGRTLFGAAPAKGQELADQYYAATPERVQGFMHELDQTLWRMGVMVKTEHNEAAPAQYEMAPLYASANVATDHNQIIMEQMRYIADHHGFTCLLHEKPFMNVNGSGKHSNWSLTTNTGKNLLKPGKDEASNKVFFTFLMAVIAAVDEYADALRMSCATFGNEHRLGGFEAPPQIISVFTGDTLYRALREFVTGEPLESNGKEHMHMGVSTLAVLHKDDSDRNRTSPFAFTGDKFEFRMVGASQSLGMPNTTLNTIVADMLSRIADALEKNPSSWKELLGDYFKKHRRVIFNGNNYAREWFDEAARRGLPNISSTVEAMELMGDAHIQEVFARQYVLTKEELSARKGIALWSFAQCARIEAMTALKIARQKILPACIRYCGEISKAYLASKQAGFTAPGQYRVLKELTDAIDIFQSAVETLRSHVREANILHDDPLAQARAMKETVLPSMVALRNTADTLEKMVDKVYWPLPSYGEMLYHIV